MMKKVMNDDVGENMITEDLRQVSNISEQYFDANYTLETLENMEEPLVVLYDPSCK